MNCSGWEVLALQMNSYGVRPLRVLICLFSWDRDPASGFTAYLKNGGTLEKAAAMANHASTRTTQLYDRRGDKITLDEVERVAI